MIWSTDPAKRIRLFRITIRYNSPSKKYGVTVHRLDHTRRRSDCGRSHLRIVQFDVKPALHNFAGMISPVIIAQKIHGHPNWHTTRLHGSDGPHWKRRHGRSLSSA